MNGGADDAYVSGEKVLQLDGTGLTGKAKIGIRTAVKPTAGNPFVICQKVGTGIDPTVEQTSYFFPDEGSTYGVVLEDGALKLKLLAGQTKYSITYDSNGATGNITDTAEYISGQIATIMEGDSLIFDGKEFAGWNLKPDGTGDSYQAGDPLLITGNVKLYALWKPIIKIGVPVYLAWGEESDIPAEYKGKSETFVLEPISNTAGIDKQNMPMPTSDTIRLSFPTVAGLDGKVGYGAYDADNPWKLSFDTAGEYTYAIKQTDLKGRTNKWNNITFIVTDTGVTIEGGTYVAGVSALSSDDFLMAGKNDKNLGLTAAKFDTNSSNPTLIIGGNNAGFDMGAIKSKFAVDFSKDFTLSGMLQMSLRPDGSTIGFTSCPNLSKENLQYGGYLCCYNKNPDFINSILMEFDSYGNGGDTRVMCGDPVGCGDGVNYAHYALMKIGGPGEAPIVVPGDNNCIYKNGQNAQYWPNGSSFQINYNATTKKLTFKCGGIEFTCDDPVSILKSDKAYLFMTGVINQGNYSGVRTDYLSFNEFAYVGGNPEGLTGDIPVGTFSENFSHDWSYSVSEDTVTAKCKNDVCYGNHNTDSGAGKLVISAEGKEYDGTACEASFDNSITELTGAEAGSISYSGSSYKNGSYGPTGSAPTDAGEYTVEVTIAGLTARKSFTIGKTTATVVLPTVVTDELVYNSQSQALIISGSSEHGHFEYSFLPDGNFSTNVLQKKDAGTYEIYYRFIGDGNHNDVNPTKLGSATINPKTIVIQPETGQSRVYGEADSSCEYTVKADPYEGEVVGELVRAVKQVDDGDAGDYDFDCSGMYVEVNGERSDNYTVVLADDSPKFSITKAEAAVSEPEARKNLIYNGAEQELVTAGSSNDGYYLYGLKEDEINSTVLPKATNADTYTVWYKFVGDKNHNDVSAKSTTIVVSPKNVTVTPLDYQAKKYGEDDPILTYDSSEKVAFDGFLAREKGEDYGTYPILQGTLAISDTNYKLEFINGKIFTINRTGAVTVPPAAKTELEYNGYAQELVTAGSSKEGHFEYSLSETGDYSTAIPVGTNSDSYTVWYIFKGDANHDDDLIPKSLTVQIAQKKLYVTPLEGQTKLYGAAEPELKYIASENVAFTGALVREAGEDAASYKISIGSLALVEDIDRNNYEIVFDATKVFTITKNGAATDVPTAKTGLVYNGAAQELINAGISEDGHYEYSLSETGDYSTAIPVGTNSDSYTVWYIFKGDANHDDDLIPKSLTVQIALRPVKVFARDNSKGLNLTDPVLEYYTEGSVDTYPLTGITVTREAGEAAGAYAIIPAIDKSVYPEYDITLVNGVFTIGEHIFDRQVPDSRYLCHESTCTSQATYYYSCECGACGTAVFSYGSTKSHITNRIVIKDATTEEEGIAEYRCIHCSFSYQVPIQKLEKPATTPTPEVTPEPTDTPAPTREPEPTDTPAPTKGAEPTDTPTPTKGAEPTDTPAPTKGAEPTDTPKPTATPDPLKNHRELNVKAEAAGSNSIKLTWNEIEDASYYVVNGAECNSKNEKHPIARLAQVGGSTTTYTVSGLEKATYYKFNVVAFDAAGNRLAKSVLARAVTAGGEYTNVSKIVLKTAKKLDLKIGDKMKVNAELKLADMSKDYYINVAFGKNFILESSDKKVVKVKNGWIIAVGKGKCKVYVYAQNGAHEVIEVNVK